MFAGLVLSGYLGHPRHEQERECVTNKFEHTGVETRGAAGTRQRLCNGRLSHRKLQGVALIEAGIRLSKSTADAIYLPGVDVAGMGQILRSKNSVLHFIVVSRNSRVSAPVWTHHACISAVLKRFA
jgi:hypothetical protein